MRLLTQILLILVTVASIAYAGWTIFDVEVKSSRAVCEAEHPGHRCIIVREPAP
jgi:hypothetical protein